MKCQINLKHSFTSINTDLSNYKYMNILDYL